MPSRKRIGRIAKPSGRLSDTPKKRTPSKTKPSRNKLAEITNTVENGRRSSSSLLKPNTTSHVEDDCFNILDFLKVSWKVYRVSPMYNLHKSKVGQYGKKLKRELVAAYSRNETAQCDCSFTFGKLLLEGTKDLIKVSVHVNSNKYIGYFISFAENESERDSLNNKHYPVLLVQAGGKILKQVHNVFCKFFDCDIHPINFSYRALISFFASMSHMYVSDVPNLSSEVVTLHYKIPGCAPSDSLAIALALDSIGTVFAAFIQEFGQTLNDAQIILGFYELIMKHVFNTYQIDLAPAELFKIIFPHFAVNSIGWVKFYSEEALKRILSGMEEFVKL